jgi:peptidoglycan/LPS O-acetylase OafA/YrhL
VRYRKEIDGLRTIAVLPVIFFHAHFAGFTGGFVGVDVFFVISGYLITGIISNDLAEGKFSFLNFYERRIRRILPLLYTVAFATFIGALFILFPWELENFSKSLAALLLFCSNIFFYSQIDYFNPTAEDSPLLHTWSLAVEEQYYFFFPVLVFFLWKFRYQWILPVIVLICLLSFYAAECLSGISAQAKFYLPQFRAWELGVGALCSLMQHKIPRNRLADNILSLCGLAMICYSVTAFTKNTPFPGKYALIPVLGSALIILFTTSTPAVLPTQAATGISRFRRFWAWQKFAFITAADSNVVTYILSIRLMVGIGLLSYSLYLWHNPVFTFARLSRQYVSNELWLCLIALVFPLSYVSWKFIEVPFRNRKTLSSKAALSATGIGSILLCAIVGGTYISNGYPGRFSAQQYDLTVPKIWLPRLNLAAVARRKWSTSRKRYIPRLAMFIW